MSPLDKKAKKFVNISRTAAYFLLSIVNNSLDFSMMQAGKFHINIEQVDVVQAIQEVADIVRV